MNNMQLFANKGRNGAGALSTPLDGLVASITKHLNQNGSGSGFATRAVAASALSLESIDSAQAHELATSVNTLQHSLESIFQDHQSAFGANDQKGQVQGKLTVAQKQAGVVAGIVGSDVNTFLRTPVSRNVPAQEGQSFLTPHGADFLNERIRPAMEAYDERENKNAVVYSVAYNMQAARQDEFGEAFFPTVVVTPDQAGITVAIRLIQVYNEVRRGISGDVNNFGKRNIVQAVIDPTILRNDQTKIVPVVRDESEAYFVPATLLAPRNVLVEGETVSTSALAMGKKFSLLGLSQTEALLESGVMDSSDAIDTAVALAALYLRVQNADASVKEVFKFNTSRLPLATFTYAPQGNYRAMQLVFETDSLLINSTTKQVTGADTALLASIGVGSYAVRLAVNVSGTVNLETAETSLMAGEVTVKSVTDVNGDQISLTVGAGAAIVALFSDAKSAMVGYELDAQRTNSNRRQRGQLLDTTFYNQIYAVPLRSPITCPRPLTTGDANDSGDLAALITATHIRTSNAAVEELMKVDAMLREFVSSSDKLDAAPAILGVARFLVQPFYEAATVDMATAVDSVKSHERAADIQAVLVNKLRDIAYRMYRDSGYKAAADALAGGVSQTPTLVIGTDPVIARYLMVDGDFRTMGPDFNVKVVSTLNNNMTGKIFMSFGDFTSGKEGLPNPMHFGNMAWKPELTLVLPIHRNGATSKELTVQPSFLHITNLPILASVTVEGIEDVIASKVTVNTAP